MAPFTTLPFEQQLARIAAVVRDEDPRPLLREAAGLADAEPFARLLEVLAAAGRLDEGLERDIAQAFETLSEAAFQHVLTRETTPPVAALLTRRVEHALAHWPLSRLPALAFAARWLRRRAPERYARITRRAEVALAGPPDEDAARWLLFAPGARLAALARDEGWGPLTARTTREAIEVLARTPKSISQANAERLLAQRVYADPGHFFFELLQNADDAGATRWSVAIEPSRVVVRHDGEPFSFLDLVGVLSIGQTTKHSAQIGFFGVGFKSVYEICERPRVRSGAFAFEIAHVSIPRALAPVAEEEPSEPGETVLVLPLAPGAPGAAELSRRALSIPPETSMTLPRIASLAVRGPDGEVTAWREAREARGPTAQVTLTRGDGDETRRYRVIERRLHYRGPREEGRATESRVLVAARLDARGAPAPHDGPTLYAFLPTAERTGLRTLVHARFDVTLDRERLVLDSPWNEALLAEAGRALAELVTALADEGADVLPLLAAPAELAPSAAPLADALTAALAEVPFLPGAGGERLSPRRARLLSPPLSRALAGVALGPDAYPLADLDARERAVALALGARPFGPDALLGFVRAQLTAGGAPPAWLGDAVLEALADAPGALRTLPILVDGAGRLASAEEARIAPAAWAALYAGQRPLVARDALAGLPSALRVRLALEDFDLAQLARDLHDEARRAALITRGDALFTALSDLDDAALQSVSELPLIPRSESASSRLSARAVHRLDPALAPLAEALAPHLALLATELERRHSALFARWLPAFDLSALAARLEAGLLLDEAALNALGERLDALAPTLPRPMLRRLAALPLALDRDGRRRPLLGPARALRPADPALRAALDWPWLASSGPFVDAVDPPSVDAPALAGALAGDPSLPAVAPAELAAAQRWLIERASELPRGSVERLAEAGIWPDSDGVPRPLSALRRGAPSPALDALYRALGGRFVASEHALRFARALGLDAQLPPNDYAALVADLGARPELAAPHRALLAEVLEEAAQALDPDALAPLAALPLFADGEGTLRPLGAWRAPDPASAHRPGPFRAVLERGPWPLLADEEERRLPRFLALAAPPPARASDVVQHAHALLDDPSALLAFLDAHAETLDRAAREAIAALPIFESAAGVRHPVGALVPRRPFRDALGEPRLAALGLDDALLAPEAEALVGRLGLSARPPAALLTERVLPALLERAPLDAQPAPWRTARDLVALASLVASAIARPEPPSSADSPPDRTAEAALERMLPELPLAVNAAGRLVRGPTFAASDAARRLAAALPLVERLADPGWADAVDGHPLAEALLTPLPARLLVDALRAACPEEAPRADHPVIADEGALFEWLRESADAIADDEAAKGALAAAAILPSQRGTLRAPRDLVLDPSVPDLGLGWGLAPDVPSDVAAWLRRRFELDRKARRALVAHLLDGVDEAAERDDVARAAALITFLARALGAGEVDAETLERRARRLDVRARLKVPVEHAEGPRWAKPRFAWAPSGLPVDPARFARSLPPRILLDEPAASPLLVACGAEHDLDDDAVLACLDGEVRDGPAARRALARYVVLRAIADPSRVQAWQLARRAWVPALDGALHPPSALLWPDALARALFGDDSPRMPDPAVLAELDPQDARQLGFARADALDLPALARLQGEREARPVLLDWLERGLREGRFAPAEVRRALGSRLLLRDEEGTLRPPRELARTGARALFGIRRGDFAEAARYPRLTRALGIPPRPDGPMITAFLVEIGSLALTPREQDLLAHHLPRCLEALAELPSAKLPAGAAVAALRGERVVLSRIGEPALRMLTPPALLEALAPSALEAALEPLPTERSPALEAMLLAAGVPDLWSAFRVREVVAGPRAPAHDAEAEALRAGLAPFLPEVGQRAQVHESLTVRGVLAGGGYRTAADALVPVDAAVHEGTLFLTPQALEAPTSLAPALASDPARRASLVAWLADEARRGPPRKLRTPARAEPREEDGFFARVRRLFTRDGPPEPEPPASEPPPEPSREARSRPMPPARNEARHFRPDDEVASQLDRTEGWMDDRRQAPTYGFAFSPPRVAAPWLYAPKRLGVRFDRRRQSWSSAPLPRPEPRGRAGELVLRGRLPKGESVLPIPLYGQLDTLRADGADVSVAPGATTVRLDAEADVRLRVVLGAAPALERAVPLGLPAALASTVPDAELPDEVLDFLASLDEAPPIVTALAVRDFVRERYRYDPTYLEDPSVGRWLARTTRGRAHAHIAALHAAGDARHLGAGVCYELNALSCELLRRAGIPAVVATGWVLDGGHLSEPDHLWALALLEDAQGPLWVPIDASTTKEGRPLRVPRRPPTRFRAPKLPAHRAPSAPRWETLDLGRDGPRGKSKKKRPPRAELLRVLRHLGQLAGGPLTDEERAEVERALTDPSAAKKLLARLRR